MILWFVALYKICRGQFSRFPLSEVVVQSKVTSLRSWCIGLYQGTILVVPQGPGYTNYETGRTGKHYCLHCRNVVTSVASAYHVQDHRVTSVIMVWF